MAEKSEKERDDKEFAQKILNEIDKDDFIFLPRNDLKLPLVSGKKSSYRLLLNGNHDTFQNKTGIFYRLITQHNGVFT